MYALSDRPILTLHQWALSSTGVLEWGPLWAFHVGDLRPKYMRATAWGFAEAGVGMYLPNYNWAVAKT